MTTFFIRVALNAFAVVAIATTAGAQDRTAPLTSIEVKERVASGQRDDHARLRDHFAALADKYAADAQRYSASAKTLTGNPNHPPAVPPGARYARLAESASASAATLQELSVHHGRLAAGQVSQAPANSAGFESGEGAPEPTDAQLRELSAGARTPSEHRALEEYFSDLAQKYARAAQRHTAMSQSYRSHPNDRGGSFTSLTVHCEQLAKQSRVSAETARVMAAEHRQTPRVG
jgi:hypothetical protein